MVLLLPLVVAVVVGDVVVCIVCVGGCCCVGRCCLCSSICGCYCRCWYCVGVMLVIIVVVFGFVGVGGVGVVFLCVSLVVVGPRVFWCWLAVLLLLVVMLLVFFVVRCVSVLLHGLFC